MSGYQEIIDIKDKAREEIKKKSIDCKQGFKRHPEVYVHSKCPDLNILTDCSIPMKRSAEVYA